MNSSAISMELSVSFVSWINEQMRHEISSRQEIHKTAQRSFVVNSAVVAASLTCITVAIASFMQW